ncbi:MAG TPA: NTP transferase domain-containing protein [bacterium]|nr:NTP transferase domain-containing protein [bacterium]HPQ67431.1 NTP transferase domain-containing protein [bacterium]
MSKKNASSCACVILAAGEGKRMKSSLPKIAHLLGGRPLLAHVLDAAAAAGPSALLAVIPPRTPALEEILRGRAEAVIQDEKLGTGDALRRAAPRLRGLEGEVVVLCGDVPLIRPETVAGLLALHRERGWAATVLGSVVDVPRGYGRIVRGEDGLVRKIVEDVEADAAQKDIREINSGIYCFSSPAVWDVLEKIGNRNRQGEYYLTDAVHLLVNSGAPVGTMSVPASEILGVNSRRQLAEAEKVFQARACARLWENGVTVLCPETVYLEAGIEVGPDTVLGPFAAVETGAVIGRGCRLGPFVRVCAGEKIADGAVRSGAPANRGE